MTRRGQRLACVLLLVLLPGCAGYTRMFIESYTDPLEPRTFHYANDAKGMYYHFDIGDAEKNDTYLFFIGGSGCHSFKYYLRRYLDGLAGKVRVFALQKRAVGDRTTGFFGCGSRFQEFDFFEQWVADQRAFVAQVLDSAKIKPGKVLVLGISEGGSVAAAVAAGEPRVTHVAIIGSGGMKQIDELRTLSRKKQFPADVEGPYRAIMADPSNASKTVWGHSYRYWSSVLERDPLDFVSRLSIPIIVGFGERDTSVPVEAAYALRDRCRALGKTNLTLIVYPEADHTLTIRDKSLRPEFMKTLTAWLDEDPFGAPPKGASPNCGPETRYRFEDKIQSPEEFVEFVKRRAAELTDYNGNNWVHLDDFKITGQGMTRTEMLEAPVDWAKAPAAVVVEKVGERTIYKLDYTPFDCPGQHFTLRMTQDGHVSLYGCCGK